MRTREGPPLAGAIGHPAMNGRTARGAMVCPECTMPLRELSEELQCPECLRRWPVVHGIPHFVQDSPYRSQLSAEEIEVVARLAEAGSWTMPLPVFHDSLLQQTADAILDLERANWRWLLTLPPKCRVLDVAADLGSNAHALATYYQEVVAMDPVLECVEFMKRRFTHAGLSNITLVRSSSAVLPFAPESFDLVVMHGALDRAADGRSGDPAILQEHALRSLFRLLKPGGYLALGVDNRFALRYLMGHPDPYCQLPFVGVLPRWLAQRYAAKHGFEGYRNYLYCARGYRRLLRKAGFEQADSYLALPSYQHPRFLIPMKRNQLAYYSGNLSSVPNSPMRRLAHRVMLKLGILEHLESSYLFIACK